MKKIIIGAIVGGLLIFVCQTISWVMLDLHRPANQYTPNQDQIMSFLNGQFTKDGGYFLPNHPEGASMEDTEKYMQDAIGKPWAIISYHRSMSGGMGLNMVRGLVVNIIMVGLFCWILSKVAHLSFSRVLLMSLSIGFIIFLNIPYTTYIWYETFDLYASLADALIGWGVAGLWLGWLYGRKERT